jgi:hypothetical protein
VHWDGCDVVAEIVTDLLLGGADGDELEAEDSSPSKKKKKGTPGKAGAGGREKVAAGDEEDGDTIAVAVKFEGVEQDGGVCGVYGEACGCSEM